MHSPQKLGHMLHSHLLVCDRLRAAQIPASPTDGAGEEPCLRNAKPETLSQLTILFSRYCARYAHESSRNKPRKVLYDAHECHDGALGNNNASDVEGRFLKFAEKIVAWNLYRGHVSRTVPVGSNRFAYQRRRRG